MAQVHPQRFIVFDGGNSRISQLRILQELSFPIRPRPSWPDQLDNEAFVNACFLHIDPSHGMEYRKKLLRAYLKGKWLDEENGKHQPEHVSPNRDRLASPNRTRTSHLPAISDHEWCPPNTAKSTLDYSRPRDNRILRAPPLQPCFSPLRPFQSAKASVNTEGRGRFDLGEERYMDHLTPDGMALSGTVYHGEQPFEDTLRGSQPIPWQDGGQTDVCNDQPFKGGKVTHDYNQTNHLKKEMCSISGTPVLQNDIHTEIKQPGDAHEVFGKQKHDMGPHLEGGFGVADRSYVDGEYSKISQNSNICPSEVAYPNLWNLNSSRSSDPLLEVCQILLLDLQQASLQTQIYPTESEDLNSRYSKGTTPQRVKQNVQSEDDLKRKRASLIDAVRTPFRIEPLKGDLKSTVETSLEDRAKNYQAYPDPGLVDVQIVPASKDVGPTPDFTGNINVPDYRSFKFGRVFLVYTGMYHGEKVAIKVFKARKNPIRSTKWELSFKRQIARELQVWKSLRHPNIIECLGSSNDFGDFGAMIFPWCQQGTAREYLEKTDPSVRVRMSLVKDVCAGLDYLHQSALVHGDLKPSNVLIDDAGTARVCDFGLAKLAHHQELGEMTATTTHAGPERYMAPELFQTMNFQTPLPTREADVYSLGCIALEFVERICPFQRLDYDDELIDAIMNGQPPAFRWECTVTPLFPLSNEFWDMLEGCWSTPEQRPDIAAIGATVQAFVARLSNKQSIPRANISPETEDMGPSKRPATPGKGKRSRKWLGIFVR